MSYNVGSTDRAITPDVKRVWKGLFGLFGFLAMGAIALKTGMAINSVNAANPIVPSANVENFLGSSVAPAKFTSFTPKF